MVDFNYQPQLVSWSRISEPSECEGWEVLDGQGSFDITKAQDAKLIAQSPAAAAASLF